MIEDFVIWMELGGNFVVGRQWGQVDLSTRCEPFPFLSVFA